MVWVNIQTISFRFTPTDIHTLKVIQWLDGWLAVWLLACLMLPSWCDSPLDLWPNFYCIVWVRLSFFISSYIVRWFFFFYSYEEENEWMDIWMIVLRGVCKSKNNIKKKSLHCKLFSLIFCSTQSILILYFIFILIYTSQVL